MKALFQYIIAGCLLVLSAFVAFYLFIAMLVVGACAFAYLSLRRFLAKPQPSSADEAVAPEMQITIIEGQFETVEEKPEPLPQKESQH